MKVLRASLRIVRECITRASRPLASSRRGRDARATDLVKHALTAILIVTLLCSIAFANAKDGIVRQRSEFGMR